MLLERLRWLDIEISLRLPLLGVEIFLGLLADVTRVTLQTSRKTSKLWLCIHARRTEQQAPRLLLDENDRLWKEGGTGTESCSEDALPN